MTRNRDAYGCYLIPRDFILDKDQPSPMRDRWVHPTSVKVDVLPVREFVGLGTGDIRYEWEVIPPDSTRFIGPVRGKGHIRLFSVLAALDQNIISFEDVAALAREEAKKYAAGRDAAGAGRPLLPVHED
jgi:hypothetical protein